MSHDQWMCPFILGEWDTFKALDTDYICVCLSPIPLSSAYLKRRGSCKQYGDSSPSKLPIGSGELLPCTSVSFIYAGSAVFFLSLPSQHGITEVKVEETADGHILHLQAEDTLIQLEEDGTHIVCDDNEPLRTALRDLVLRFLMKL